MFFMLKRIYTHNRTHDVSFMDYYYPPVKLGVPLDPASTGVLCHSPN